jgi:hypothetical protein
MNAACWMAEDEDEAQVGGGSERGALEFQEGGASAALGWPITRKRVSAFVP